MLGYHTPPGMVTNFQTNVKPQMPPNGQKHVWYIVENYFLAYKNPLRDFKKLPIFGRLGWLKGILRIGTTTHIKRKITHYIQNVFGGI